MQEVRTTPWSLSTLLLLLLLSAAACDTVSDPRPLSQDDRTRRCVCFHADPRVNDSSCSLCLCHLARGLWSDVRLSLSISRWLLVLLQRPVRVKQWGRKREKMGIRFACHIAFSLSPSFLECMHKLSSLAHSLAHFSALICLS